MTLDANSAGKLEEFGIQYRKSTRLYTISQYPRVPVNHKDYDNRLTHKPALEFL